MDIKFNYFMWFKQKIEVDDLLKTENVSLNWVNLKPNSYCKLFIYSKQHL